MLDQLKQRLSDRSARIGVIGLGYVGLPLILRLSAVGFPVAGFDINANHIADLTAGRSPFTHIPDADVARLAAADTVLTTDFSKVADVDAVLICLPTPLDRYRQPDLSYVTRSVETIRPYLHTQMLLSLESTTWPGTTDEILLPMVEETGMVVGQDIALVFSPEREDPGNEKFALHQIPKVVGGVTSECLSAGEMLYGAIVDQVVPVSSTRAAELTKLLENIQRSINIGLMNEMKGIAQAMDIDIFEVIGAAATKPFGFTPYFPGPGLGGHCIPIDPFYLTWKAKEYGINTRFIELAGEINGAMPRRVVDALQQRLSAQLGKALRDARVLVAGIAYKKNINDLRESPALYIMDILQARGADVSYTDPFCPEIPSTRDHPGLTGMASVDPASATWDAVLVVTDHEGVDYPDLADRAGLIIDTRNVYSGDARQASEKIFTA
ncbi:MAG: nucleotide sugar dehydrogenase [Pseudomonadota bacterium]